jgi:flavin-dependent dehydrogenase
MMPQPNNQNEIEAPLSQARGEGSEADCIIIGGGLAGLSASILLARQGWNVLLFEKNKYPFHRVCGEYISLESKPFLERLGMDIDPSRYPHIKQLLVTAVSGVEVNRPLDLGGFGISRYEIDYRLSLLAIEAGVTILNERVEDTHFEEDLFHVKTSKGNYTGKICIGSFGKRSNLDVKLQRPFIKSAAKGLNNYLGIKYHIRYPQPKELIALHNFSNGYCGISSIEDDKCCLCYLTTANNLASNGNDIALMEKNVLFKNPHLQKIFSEAEFLYPGPLVISQISFANKEQELNHIIFCGDAAGLITPLCGNGMSMALKSSHMLAPLADLFFKR